jgi:uncharacterized membrane protein YeaQ/YmgE (transglycosylase-associated protein family)
LGPLSWIVVGLLAGFIAHVVLGGRGGILVNIAVGLVGAIIGGALLPRLGLPMPSDFIGNLVSATIGAIILIGLWRLIRRG